MDKVGRRARRRLGRFALDGSGTSVVAFPSEAGNARSSASVGCVGDGGDGSEGKPGGDCAPGTLGKENSSPVVGNTGGAFRNGARAPSNAVAGEPGTPCAGTAAGFAGRRAAAPIGEAGACGGQFRLGVAAPHLVDFPVPRLLTPRPLTGAARPMGGRRPEAPDCPTSRRKARWQVWRSRPDRAGRPRWRARFPTRAHRLHPLRVLVRARPLLWDHLYSWYWLTSTSSRTPSASVVRTAIEQYREIK